LADEKDHKEAASRTASQALASGDLLSAAQLELTVGGLGAYESPLRGRAVTWAHQAIDSHRRATQEAVSSLNASTRVLTPPRPRPAAKKQDQLPWYKKAGRVLKHGAESVVDAGGYLMSHPDDSLRLGGDAAGVAAGYAMFLLGDAGEVGGFALDATGVGAVAGVPVNVASAGLIATGVTTAALSGAQFAKDARDTMNEARSSGDGGGSGGGPESRFEPKIEKQLEKRGWSQESVDETIQNPDKTVSTRDTRWRPDGTQRNDSATAYIDKDGNYVVRNDVDGTIVQISDKFNPNWKAPW